MNQEGMLLLNRGSCALNSRVKLHKIQQEEGSPGDALLLSDPAEHQMIPSDCLSHHCLDLEGWLCKTVPRVSKSAVWVAEEECLWQDSLLSLSSYDRERQTENQTTAVQPHFLHAQQGHPAVLRPDLPALHFMEEAHCKAQKSFVINFPLLMRQVLRILPVQEHRDRPGPLKLSGMIPSYTDTLLGLC